MRVTPLALAALPVQPPAGPHTWENIPEVGRDNYRTLMRAVLRAALADDGAKP